MSAADYAFIPTDPEDAAIWLTDLYEEIMGVTVRPASPERLFIQWIAEAVVLERVLTNYAANQNIPSRAAGENLDALAELFSLQKRPQAEAARCTMRFTISEAQESDVLIPAGTRATDAGAALVWATLEDVYVSAGERSAEVKAQCLTAGAAGNGYTPGQINTIVDPFIYSVACENVTQTDGGEDEATDEEFYELLRLSMDAYSCAGARGGYVYFAKQVSTQIADAVAASPTPGVVKIYALMEDGTGATQEIKEKILAACSADTVRPLTDYVTVEDPETVEYSIDLTYYIPSGGEKSAAELETAVRAKADEFAAWQSGKLGRDVNPSKLIALLMETGIKRVDVREPAFTALRDGSTGQAPQVAALGTVNIVKGGYEDE